MLDLTNLNPLRPRRRRAFHEEEFTRRAVRITLHHHRAIEDVRQQHWRDVDVVLNQVSLRNAELRPEEFAEIRELDDAIANLHIERVLIFGKFDVRDGSLTTLY